MSRDQEKKRTEFLYKTIGSRLKEMRKLHGLTQLDLSEKAGISVSFLSFLESGARQGSLETYYNLAGALGSNLSELFKEPQGEKSRSKSSPIPAAPGLSVAEAKAVYKLVKSLRKSR